MRSILKRKEITMSVYLSCKVAVMGPDELKEAFVKQVWSEFLWADLSKSDDVFFISGRNYDADKKSMHLVKQ